MYSLGRGRISHGDVGIKFPTSQINVPWSDVLKLLHYLFNKKPADPNALIGPAGSGRAITSSRPAPCPYTVDFENDGSVAAQDVTVTEQLDPNLDWSTFQLGSFGFGSVNITDSRRADAVPDHRQLTRIRTGRP